MVRARRAPWRAAPWPRSGAAWAFSGRRTADAALSLGPRPDVPAGAVSPAVSRDRVRRRHRPRARARRQAGRVADQHPDLPRLGDLHQAVRRHGHGERRSHAHRGADRDRRGIHRRGNDPSCAAGPLLRARGAVVVLTSAATIWVVAAIGVALGAAFYWEAAGTTLLVLLVLPGLGRVGGLGAPPS